MQDASNNAMTEVALGLSMAFFALLVVTLISIGLKAETNQKAMPEVGDNAKPIQVQSDTGEGSNNKTFLFYFHGKLYDQNKTIVLPADLTDEKQWVIAVPPELTVADLVSLQNKLARFNTELTLMSDEWHRFFVDEET